MLTGVLKAASSQLCAKQSMDDDHRNCLIMCRSKRLMNYLQAMVGIILYDGHVSKKVKFPCFDQMHEHVMHTSSQQLCSQTAILFYILHYVCADLFQTAEIWHFNVLLACQKIVARFGDGFDEQVKR